MSRSEYASQQSALQRQYFPKTGPLPGVADVLNHLTARKTYIALATSSHAANFQLKTKHLDSLFEAFPVSNRVLGDDKRIAPGRGKPAPDIYLIALETINEGIRARGGEREVQPDECLVFEDSVPGVEAGRRAGMRVIWCPHKELLKEYKGREKQVLAGIANEKQDAVVRDAIKEAGAEARVTGQPGELDDGWAELLHSLEDISWTKYGLSE